MKSRIDGINPWTSLLMRRCGTMRRGEIGITASAQEEKPLGTGSSGSVAPSPKGLIKRILIPLDGSRLAESVLPPMVRLAKSSQGSILLIHAVTPAESFAMSAGEFVAHERKRSAEYLARLAERVGEEGIGIEERIVTGEPSRAIVSTAGRDKVDLIAMSTHGRSGIREWVFGSVAERVLRSTRLPVLLFRGESDRRFDIKKILVPLDGSKDALEILKPVGQLAEALQAEVQILHVGKDLPQALKGAMLAFTRRRIPHRTVLRQSKSPAGAILEYARESQADLIAMTPTGGSGGARVSFGKVAEAVLKDADRPILMIRAGQKR